MDVCGFTCVIPAASPWWSLGEAEIPGDWRSDHPVKNSFAMVLVASSMKLDIRVAGGAGRTHLVRSVDDVDLPFLLDLISQLQIEPSAVVTLTETGPAHELVIMIDQSRYRVERSAAGSRSRLAADPVRSEGSAAADDLSVDLESARLALRSVILEKPLEAGLRWIVIDG